MPSFSPFSLILWPSTVFVARLMQARLVRRILRPGAARSMVQPVKTRATSVTSCCV